MICPVCVMDLNCVRVCVCVCVCYFVFDRQPSAPTDAAETWFTLHTFLTTFGIQVLKSKMNYCVCVCGDGCPLTVAIVMSSTSLSPHLPYINTVSFQLGGREWRDLLFSVCWLYNLSGNNLDFARPELIIIETDDKMHKKYWLNSFPTQLRDAMYSCVILSW